MAVPSNGRQAGAATSLPAITVRNARAMALVVGVAALVFWPLDRILFDPPVAEAFRVWRFTIATLGLGAYLVLARRRPASVGWADVVAIVVVLCLGAASCGVGFALSGGLRDPWFHDSYLLPLTTVPLLLPLWARALATLSVVASFTIAYFLTTPEQLASPLVPGVLSFLCFSLVAGVATGHVVFRVSVENFLQRQRLAEDAARLRELSRSKSELFANVSHELRTPLTLILTSLRSVQGLPGVDATVVDAGLRNTARLLLLIDDLLQMSRLQLGRGAPRLEAVDVVAVVREVAHGFRSGSVDAKELVIEAREPEAWACVDHAQLVTALYNLLSNAFKFSEPGRRRVRVRIGGEADELRVEVEDNGIGIRADQLGRIFERFEQIEGDARRRQGGVGIGLALVRDIAQAHGGRVAVTSEVGAGSCFTLVLPRRLGAAVDRTGDAGLASQQAGLIALMRSPVASGDAGEVDAGASARVLVAEDDPDLRRFLVRILRRSFRVIEAADGEAALELARAQHPELIVTDIMMPGRSGLELVRAIRQEPGLARVPALVLTAVAGSEPRLAAYEAGAEDFLTKPFEADELLARVTNLLAIRRQEQELSLVNQRLERRVAERTEELRRLTVHLESVREDERRRLARELHDETGQLLTALRLELAVVRPLLVHAGDDARQALARMDEGLEQLLGLVRQIITDLRPRILDDLGLAAALRWYVTQFSARTGLSAQVVVVDERAEPSGECAIVLFRVLQEALTNVARHAQARRVVVGLDTTVGHVALTVQDDGVGFSVDRRGNGMGILGMGERVRALGGELQVESEPGRGTTCRASLPCVAARELAA